ncbi:(R)-mandelonitrile lyase 3-like [Pyrus ussuriensis x Pyrus communis]|uniref:(R)-mandelonitrile lyase n=1 Tax=Pyrus ussuriensis x Pyrus communis TaxID=2448454 RepID=A0A5N5FEC1_9ROSA|nr:(R)-mandelonitrile lyase 3-like [Pyrus ussuriensis x Pyrus communis]
MEKSMVLRVLLVLQLCVHLQSEVQSLATPSEHDFSYSKSVVNATDLPQEEVYDYIVVGGGTAGCPLATTLSLNYLVLVLERGSFPTSYPNQEDDGETPVRRIMSEDGIPTVRGRILGGTSISNAGVYARANISFFSQSGVEWDMDLVNATYEWIEDTIVYKPKCIRLANCYTSSINAFAWQTVTQEVFLEAGVLPDNGFSLDHVLGTRITGSTFDNNGTRHAADELLNKGDLDNLRVAVHANIEKILISSTFESNLSARGVIFKDSNGISHWAYVRNQGEVILSAGTMGTPQLLGVGPESSLSSLGIPVVIDHPYVGHFLYGNPRNFINILPPNPGEGSIVTALGIRNNFWQCSISGGLLTVPPYSFFRCQSYPLPNSTFVHIPNKVPGPLSHGSLTLNSSNDVGLKQFGDLLRTDAFKPHKTQDLPGVEGFTFLGVPFPNNQIDDALETFCHDSLASYWHYHGGCIVGKVVDGGLRVSGIDAFRVVDSSTFPVTPASHPMGFYLMLGRYMGLQILQERPPWVGISSA